MSLAMRIAVCAAVLGMACGGEDGFSPPPGPPVSNALITISDNAYSPRTVLLSASGTVTWTWTVGNNNSHNVVFTTAGAPTGHPTLKANGSDFTATFTQTGQFNFHCSNHGSMTGAIFVQ